MQKKVCVLFGAGADKPMGMCGGEQFVRYVLGSKRFDDSNRIKEMNKAIKARYDGLISDNDYWYPKYRGYSWNEDDLLRASIRKRNLETDRKQTQHDFTCEFRAIRSNTKAKEDLLAQYPSIMGLIDGKFHSLIAPSILGRGRFWQVVSCYCRAYLAIMEDILHENDFKDYMNPSPELISRVRSACRSKADEESYYSVVKDIKESVDISVVTTNYTFFCEEIAELGSEQIAYVHGKIGLYESPRDLCVYDIERECFKDNVVFPYLFIQSGIKPIVESKQIKEYSKAVDFLENADKVLIVGYRLNYDDNHINSMIRRSIEKGAQVTYLSFEPNDKEDDRKMVMDKLRLHNEPDSFSWKEINRQNAVIVFREELLN